MSLALIDRLSAEGIVHIRSLKIKLNTVVSIALVALEAEASTVVAQTVLKSGRAFSEAARLLVLSHRWKYHYCMDIQSLSMDMAQSKLSDQVGTTMLAKSLGGMQEQGDALLNLLGPASTLPEGSGTKIDTYA